jgi:superfamily II DNA/RNA helicase
VNPARTHARTPAGPDDYIHRIGRTGRAGAAGVADTLFTPRDRPHAGELVRILTDAGQEVPEALVRAHDSQAKRALQAGKGKGTTKVKI